MDQDDYTKTSIMIKQNSLIIILISSIVMTALLIFNIFMVNFFGIGICAVVLIINGINVLNLYKDLKRLTSENDVKINHE